MVKPVNGNIVVEKEMKDQSIGNIVLSTNVQKEEKIAKVIAIYDGCTEYQVDDIIIYPEYSGVDIEVEGKELILVNKADIMAIIK